MKESKYCINIANLKKELKRIQKSKNRDTDEEHLKSCIPDAMERIKATKDLSDYIFQGIVDTYKKSESGKAYLEKHPKADITKLLCNIIVNKTKNKGITTNINEKILKKVTSDDFVPSSKFLEDLAQLFPSLNKIPEYQTLHKEISKIEDLKSGLQDSVGNKNGEENLSAQSISTASQTTEERTTPSSIPLTNPKPPGIQANGRSLKDMYAARETLGRDIKSTQEPDMVYSSSSLPTPTIKVDLPGGKPVEKKANKKSAAPDYIPSEESKIKNLDDFVRYVQTYFDMQGKYSFFNHADKQGLHFNSKTDIPKIRFISNSAKSSMDPQAMEQFQTAIGMYARMCKLKKFDGRFKDKDEKSCLEKCLRKLQEITSEGKCTINNISEALKHYTTLSKESLGDRHLLGTELLTPSSKYSGNYDILGFSRHIIPVSCNENEEMTNLKEEVQSALIIALGNLNLEKGKPPLLKSTSSSLESFKR